MELIAEIYEHDVQVSQPNFNIKYTLRKSARAVLFRENKKIAIIYVSKDKYHKLPGGGLEHSETAIDALKRELIEEVGASMKIFSQIGCTIEYRNQFEQLQLSYFFRAEVDSFINAPSYTQDELSLGFKLIWCSVEEAIGLLKNDRPISYVGKFINRRDLLTLQFLKVTENFPI